MSENVRKKGRDIAVLALASGESVAAAARKAGVNERTLLRWRTQEDFRAEVNAARAEMFARLANLFDREYATAGFLARNSFNPNGSFIANPANWSHEDAISPAQPRAVWAGVRLRWQ